MKKLWEEAAVTACGAVTSLLTAIAVLLVYKLTGFNLFTLSFWVILPVGALITGFGAASGYYFGALYFHHKPSLRLLLNMVIIAGGTQILIYYLEFATLVLEDGSKVSDLLPFGEYMRISLTTAKYSLARHRTSGGIEVGSFGYVLAGIQLLGFVVGGLCIFGALISMDICDKCQKYFRSLVSITKTFSNSQAYEKFGEKFLKAEPPSSEYLAGLEEPHTVAKVEQGAVRLCVTLLGCPECKKQLVVEKTEAWNGKDWNEVSDLGRKHQVPESISLVENFRVSKAA
jgi:hypothetical protein